VSLDAYLPLCKQLGLAPEQLPYTPNWSAAPDFLELIVDHALTTRPTTIVECGSGMTTLMLARCCAMNGYGHLYSLENGAEYAVNSRAAITAYGLQDYSTVLYAPLIHYTVGERDYQWYDISNLTVANIDMLVIDGPPGFLQRHSRYPALPLLFERLHEESVVFMDDAARPDERELVAMWQEQYPAVNHRFIDNERGCSVVQFGAS
jgi:predicted O-methyltransferase YrrM